MAICLPYLINYLSEMGHLQQVYEVLNDPTDVVTLMNVLNDTGTMPQFEAVSKSETISNMYRSEGNQFYKDKLFRSALESYNKSLCYAPNNSTAMKLAYGNRSALLYTVKQYSACINDINTIFSMGCTEFNLAQRLRQRKIECEKLAWISDAGKKMMKNEVAENFFNFHVERHPEIRCASTDIDVIIESGLPKVVAARDIEVGTLVALEPPFVCELNSTDYWMACHYCHKFTLNLMPCDGCCATLFCDETCRIKCYTEFHNIECQIMNRFQKENCVRRLKSRMPIKAALKMKQKCKTWKELIAASFSIGEDRLRNSCVRDIYDEKSKFSILGFDNNLHFIHGTTINHSILCAIDLDQLMKIPNFWPTCEEEKEAAERALARIMVELYLFYPKIPIQNTRLDAYSGVVVALRDQPDFNYGWFAFTSKLKHSCEANLLALGLKNNIALITSHPIQKGSELNVSYLGHYAENPPLDKRGRLLHHGVFHTRSCRVCVEKWSVFNFTDQELTAEEMKYYKQWISKTPNNIKVEKNQFKTTCKALGKLQNIAGTREYQHVFQYFRKFLSCCQLVATDNVYLRDVHSL